MWDFCVAQVTVDYMTSVINMVTQLKEASGPVCILERTKFGQRMETQEKESDRFLAHCRHHHALSLGVDHISIFY